MSDSPPPALTYFVEASGQRFGPADLDLLRQWAREGRINSESILIEESTQRRFAARDLPGIFEPGMSPPQPFAGPSPQPTYPPTKRFPVWAIVLIVCCVLCLCGVPIGAALIVPKVIGKQDQAKITAAQADENSLEGALKTFRLDCDRYPTTNEGLNALRTPPPGLEGKWKGPYLDKDVPNDPWGNPYIYKCPAQNGPDSFSITSYGASGQPGPDAIVDNAG